MRVAHQCFRRIRIIDYGWSEAGVRGARAGDLAVGLDNEPAARTQVRFYLYLKYTHTHINFVPRIASSHTIKY